MALETIRVTRARLIAQWHEAVQRDDPPPLPPPTDNITQKFQVRLEQPAVVVGIDFQDEDIDGKLV